MLVDVVWYAMETLIIRNGTVEDGDRVREIAFDTFPDFGMVPDPEGIDSELGSFGETSPELIAQLVAEVGSVVIGSVILSRSNETRGKLTGFYVDPSYRGHGAGRALLVELFEKAKKAKLREIYLETWGKMEAAIHLYESLGWIREEDPAPESGASRSYLLKLD